MGFTSREQITTIILMLSSVTSVLALSTLSSYPKDFKRHASPYIDWEPGLKEAARQVLLRNRDLSKSIRDKLLTTPIIGKENRALPFGDIAVLARGQLFAVPEGFRWIQDPYQNDCIDCHATRFCKHNECGVYKPHGSEKLLALWSVKRIRHRTGDLGHRYELEYTISPINPHNKNTYIDRYGGFNYNIPGHVFIVKTQNEQQEFIKTHNMEHFVSNSGNWNNHKYIPAGLPPPPLDDYYLPIPSTDGHVIHPLKPSNNKYLPVHHGSRPDYHYLPQKPTQSYHHTTTDLTHPGYPRTTPITPFTESYNRGSEQSPSVTDQNFTGPTTTSHTVIQTTTTKTSGTTTLQLPASTDRYFPESTPHVIKIPPKPPQPNTPFKKPGIQEIPEDYSDEYELFPEDKNRTTTSTPKTTTGIPKPTEGLLLHEDEYYPNRIKEEEVDKAIALFDKEFTQKPFVMEEFVNTPVVNKEFDDVFENGTAAKPSNEEDMDLFPVEPSKMKSTTQRSELMTNVKNEHSDLFSDQSNKENEDNTDLFPAKSANNSEENIDLFLVKPIKENTSKPIKENIVKPIKENTVKSTKAPLKRPTNPIKATTTGENSENNPIGDDENSEDVDLFINSKLTTERLQIIPTASYENIKDEAKIIYSGFFEPSTTPMMTTEKPTTEFTTTQIPSTKIKRKKHIPTLPTNRIDEISTKQSLSTSVSYKVNKYKRRRAPTRIPEVRKATTAKNKFEVKYTPKHVESRMEDGSDLIQIESNNARGNNSKLAKYRKKLYARTRKIKTRIEN